MDKIPEENVIYFKTKHMEIINSLGEFIMEQKYPKTQYLAFLMTLIMHQIEIFHELANVLGGKNSADTVTRHLLKKAEREIYGKK